MYDNKRNMNNQGQNFNPGSSKNYQNWDVSKTSSNFVPLYNQNFGVPLDGPGPTSRNVSWNVPSSANSQPSLLPSFNQSYGRPSEGSQPPERNVSSWNAPPRSNQGFGMPSEGPRAPERNVSSWNSPPPLVSRFNQSYAMQSEGSRPPERNVSSWNVPPRSNSPPLLAPRYSQGFGMAPEGSRPPERSLSSWSVPPRSNSPPPHVPQFNQGFNLPLEGSRPSDRIPFQSAGPSGFNSGSDWHLGPSTSQWSIHGGTQSYNQVSSDFNRKGVNNWMGRGNKGGFNKGKRRGQMMQKKKRKLPGGFEEPNKKRHIENNTANDGEQKPLNKPEKKQENTPEKKPVIKTPGNTPQNKPGNTPQNKPGNTPQNKQGKKPGNTPQNKQVKKPGNTPQNKPVKKPGNTPQNKKTKTQNGNANKDKPVSSEPNPAAENSQKLSRRKTRRGRRGKGQWMHASDPNPHFSCCLCCFDTQNETEIQKHFKCTLHHSTLKHLCTYFPKQEVDFLQEYMVYDNWRLNANKSKDFVPKNGSFRGIGQEHFFRRVEAAHCIACDVLIPDIHQRLMEHIKTESHSFNRRALNQDLKKKSIKTADWMLKDKRFKQMFAAHVKGEDPFKTTEDVLTTVEDLVSEDDAASEDDVIEVPCKDAENEKLCPTELQPRQTEEGGPINLEEDPINLEEGPINLEEGPINLEEGPINLEEGPVNPKDAPIDLEETPVNPEDAPIDLEETPVNPEDAPIDLEETPVNPEDAPIDPEETPVNPEDAPSEPQTVDTEM